MELKKVLLYAGIPLVIIFGPLLAISSPAMGCYQSQIDKNPNTESSKNWQMRLAGICMSTMRAEMAATMYGKFAERYPDEPRRPEALWYQAAAYEKSEKIFEAKEVLVQLRREYPNHDYGKQADERLTRHYHYYVK